MKVRLHTGYMCSRACYRFKSDSFVPSLFRRVPLRRAAPSPALSTLVLARRFIRIVAISEALFQKKCPHSPRRTEEQEGEEGGGKDGGEGCFAGGKIFLTAFTSPPTSDLSHSSLRSPPPFRGTFSTDVLALFLTLFHSEKLSSRSRAPPRPLRYV